MIGWVAPTDIDWFTFLASGPPREEVNFWTPSDYFGFHAEPGAPFFFKLKKPYYKIAGFGYFSYFAKFPEFYAWQCFGQANGAPSFDAMKARLDRIRQRNRMQGRTGLEQIGCIMLSNPVFFPEKLWIPQPSDWPPRNLRPKRYPLEKDEGKRIWDDCLPTSVMLGVPAPDAAVEEPVTARLGAPTLIRPRLGQGAFRAAVTEAYGRACAVTTEHSLPALEAAHIKPFAESGPHRISNGLLLRSDLHHLFDSGYVTVTPDLHLEVSGLLKEHFDNGHSYYPLKGRAIHVPGRPADRPDPVQLRWHNEHRFLG